MSELALKLINENKEKYFRGEDATYLELGNCEIREIPDELFELVWLETLIFSSEWLFLNKDGDEFLEFKTKNKGRKNQINKLNSRFGNLKKLKILIANGEDKYKNKWHINDISVLSNLINLEILELEYNQIENLNGLQFLKNLKCLSIGGNGITDIGFLNGLKNLEQLNLSETGINDLRPIYKLSSLTYLNIYDLKIKNISFLNEFKELTGLHIGTKDIDSLAPIENLTNLIILGIHKTQFTNFDFLSRFTKLKRLYLPGNNISEISFVKTLTNLKALFIQINKIEDISSIRNLSDLKKLSFYDNKISDISSIENLIGLETLFISSNNINDIKALKNLINLKFFYSFGNKIIDYNPLRELKNLIELSIDKLQNPDLSFLSNFKVLELLIISESKLNDIQIINGLSSLKNLQLGNNQITDISPLVNLKHLKKLRISSNQISDITSIQKLTNLEELAIASNKITQINALSELTNLTKLELGKNEITNLKYIEKLQELEELDVSDNKIEEISCLKKIVSLKILDINNNNLKVIPTWITELPKLERLYIYGNPIENIPNQIFEEKYKNVLGGLKDYFVSIQNKNEVFCLYEAKLILVGRGAVGKSELVEALTEPDYKFIEGRERTEIIKIKKWEIPECIHEGKEINFKVNIWDFPGQDMLYGVHQYFLTNEALYLLVWAPRLDDDLQTFEYWPPIIGLLSDNSPVLLVQNKVEDFKKDIKKLEIQNNFPFINDFYDVSLKEWKNEKWDLVKLKSDIKKKLISIVGEGKKWNKNRIRIREILESMQKDYITEFEFLEICKENNVDEKQASFLSDDLNKLGVIIHRQDNPVIKNIVILNPEWATSAFYKIIGNANIKDNQKGNFKFEDLLLVWSDPKYYGKHHELLHLMIKYELCFQFQDENRFIIPEISPIEPLFELPDYSKEEVVLNFEYHYNIMPKNIITKFICRNHKFIKEELYWQSGAVLLFNDTEAFVQISTTRTNKKLLRISISGPDAENVLSYLYLQFSIIHDGYKNLIYEEKIPCCCNFCQQMVDVEKKHYFEYDLLKKYKRKGKSLITCEKGELEDVPVDLLLKGLMNAERLTQSELRNYIGKIDKKELFSVLKEIINNVRPDIEIEKLRVKSQNMETESFYLAGSKDSAINKAKEVLNIIERNDLMIEGFSFINLGGGDGTELIYELNNSGSNFGILMEFDNQSIDRARINIAKNLKDGKEIYVFRGDINDQSDIDIIKSKLKEKKPKGAIITIHAVLHELSQRSKSQFVPSVFFSRLYELHNDILLIVREPGKANGNNWEDNNGVFVLMKELNDLQKLEKAGKELEIRYFNKSKVETFYNQNRIYFENKSHAIESLFILFYWEEKEYELQEQKTSFEFLQIYQILKNCSWKIMEHQTFASGSFKEKIVSLNIKFLDDKLNPIPEPHCFHYIIANKEVSIN